MKKIGYIILILTIIPISGFAQLKKDVDKPNISKSLETTYKKDVFAGFLDPSRFHMSHSLSMSYMAFGGGGAMINTYINTLNYRFSDNLFLTTKLGIMNSPYNSLPGNNFFNDSEFFGGAELKYLPSEKSVISLRFEKVPGYYPGSYYYNFRNPFRYSQTDW